MTARDYVEAEVLLQEALSIRRKVFGLESPQVARSMYNLGRMFLLKKDFASAEKWIDRALSLMRKSLKEDHQLILITLNDLAVLYHQTGRHERMIPILNDILENRRTRLGDEHPETLTTINNLAAALLETTEPREALSLLRDSETAARRVWANNKTMLGKFLAKLGESKAGIDDFRQAESDLLEAHQLLIGGAGAEDPGTIGCVKRLVILYEAWHESDPVGGHDKKAREWRMKVDPAVFDSEYGVSPH